MYGFIKRNFRNISQNIPQYNCSDKIYLLLVLNVKSTKFHISKSAKGIFR